MNHLKRYNENFNTELSTDNLLEVIDMFEIEDLNLGLDKHPHNGPNGYYHIGFFKPPIILKSSPILNGFEWVDIKKVIHVIIDLNRRYNDNYVMNVNNLSELDSFLKSFEDRLISAGYILDKQIPGHYYYLSYIYLS